MTPTSSAPTLVTEGSGVAIVALAGGLATWGEVAVAMDTGLVAAGVGGLVRLVAEGALVALMALATVGEGVKGQAKPVHTPVGTRCCQDLLVWHQHAQPPVLSMAWLSTSRVLRRGWYSTTWHNTATMAQHRCASGMAPARNSLAQLSASSTAGQCRDTALL